MFPLRSFERGGGGGGFDLTNVKALVVLNL